MRLYAGGISTMGGPERNEKGQVVGRIQNSEVSSQNNISFTSLFPFFCFLYSVC